MEGLMAKDEERRTWQWKHGRRKDQCENIYGMEPTSGEIYDLLYEAGLGNTTKEEEKVLEKHIQEKMAEIRKRKMEFGLEGGAEKKGQREGRPSIPFNFDYLPDTDDYQP